MTLDSNATPALLHCSEPVGAVIALSVDGFSHELPDGLTQQSRVCGNEGGQGVEMSAETLHSLAIPPPEEDTISPLTANLHWSASFDDVFGLSSSSEHGLLSNRPSGDPLSEGSQGLALTALAVDRELIISTSKADSVSVAVSDSALTSETGDLPFPPEDVVAKKVIPIERKKKKLPNLSSAVRRGVLSSRLCQNITLYWGVFPPSVCFKFWP